MYAIRSYYGQQRPAQVDVDDAVPGVADATVHLHGRLADRSRGARAVGLGHAPRRTGLPRLERVHRPRRVQSRAPSALGQDVRLV